jgi:predicted HTH domain antitoxin
MSITIPDEVLQTAQLSPEELLQELAILLYCQGRLTMGQASQLAQMTRLEFQQLLASRKVPVNSDLKEFASDLETLRKAEYPD